jgi:deoxyribonucleoside regulator
MLAQIAVWYYEDGLDQAAIADRIGKSRSMVSRMLNEVRQLGLVEIKVKYPLKRSAQLENALIERFHLKGAWVMARPEGVSDAFTRRLLGRTAAGCLQRYIADGIHIGVAWSRTLHHMVIEVAEQVVRDAMVVQISGSVSVDNPKFDGPELVRKLAHKLGAEYRYFPAPLVVRDAALKRSLLEEAQIVEALRVGERVDVAVLGIGNVLSAESSLRSSGLVDDDTLHELIVNDVAGDIIARQFDPKGSLLGVAFNERVVGMDPAALKRVPTVIAVSNGAEKSRSILAGIRGGWFNVLVSDASTVTELLAYADMHDETEGK